MSWGQLSLQEAHRWLGIYNDSGIFDIFAFCVLGILWCLLKFLMNLCNSWIKGLSSESQLPQELQLNIKKLAKMNFLLAVMHIERSFKHVGTHIVQCTSTVHLSSKSVQAFSYLTTSPEIPHPEQKKLQKAPQQLAKPTAYSPHAIEYFPFIVHLAKL